MQCDTYTFFKDSLCKATQDGISISSFSNVILGIQLKMAPDQSTRYGVFSKSLSSAEFTQMVLDLKNSKKDDVQKDYFTLFSHVNHARIDSEQAITLAKALVAKHKLVPKIQDVKPDAMAGGAAQGGADASSPELEAVKAAEKILSNARTATVLSNLRVEQAEAELQAAKQEQALTVAAEKQAIQAHENAVRACNDRKRKRE